MWNKTLVYKVYLWFTLLGKFILLQIIIFPKSWTMIQKHKLSLLHGGKNIALQPQILVFTSWVMVQIVASTLSLVVFACVSIQKILDSDSCRGFNNSTLCEDEEAEFLNWKII